MDTNNNDQKPTDVKDRLSSIRSSIESMQNNLNKDYVEEKTEVQPIEEANSVAQNTNIEVNSDSLSNQSPKKPQKNSSAIIAIIFVILIAAGGFVWLEVFNGKDLFTKNNENNGKEITPEKYASEYRISGNSLENFDLYFLKLENEKVNKIYSPLSIKYALEMLNEGADGDTKDQISSVVGDYNGKKYVNSENMSLANALFIRDSFKDSINDDYINVLKDKYEAEVSYDTFESADNLNSWVKSKTLNLIDGLFDSIPQETNFILVNALAIDMEWKNLIQPGSGRGGWRQDYQHEKFSAYVSSLVGSGYHTLTFNDDYSAKSVEIGAAINNYNIIEDIGEDKIRETVGAEYQKFLDDDVCKDAATRPDVNTYLDSYIEEIGTGYGVYSSSTDFLLYVDSDVKAFAKDLKEYNGTTLQYVGIMPINTSLDEYINNASATSINSIISNLKSIDPKNFKDGVITKITGYIPLFKFDYKLNLQADLEKLGIVDVFSPSKSNLTKLSNSPGVYIGNAIHKANIEFSNEGIKAAAVTAMGGWGAAGCDFDYDYEVPVEEIDVTFDKPYMFIIRDKDSGEVWFTGTVYEPIEWSSEKQQQEQQELYQNLNN